MTKFLGIDYGSKRVGIALSDDGGRIAFPRGVFANDKKLLENVVKLCDDENISGIVMGESTNSQGKPNSVHFVAKSFAKDFATKCTLPIYWEPEFMTSMHAAIGERKGEFKKEALDASAAALILQRFLDKRNNK
ncbi:MAG TPA: Holliday junction resolvase RuvX [Candidatus Yonathbacteria bacterium]|nr:Holliday junction resolvase RuvX [Candidatus Yonathbacteria bacterium]